LPDSKISASGTFIRLPLHLRQIGEKKHRAGWPFVVERLGKFHRPEGILFDDFIERSFQTPKERQTWREPWIGVFHHPPNLPDWLDPAAPIKTIIATAEFQESLPHLRGAIALSEHLGGWLRGVLRCPVLVRKHPTAIPDVMFSLERWEGQSMRRIIQVGWYARNHRAIYQVEVPQGFRKIHLLPDKPWVRRAIGRSDEFSPYREHKWIGEVDVMGEANNSQYDYLMATSVVLNQYWDVSASNTVIEAIARNTPMLVNRHPALIEYLGANYPLFFDELRDVRAMLESPDLIRQGWKYLMEMDKSWLSVDRFADDVIAFVRSLSEQEMSY